MGKKNRRMRWRTLTITDEQISDSDESTTTTTIQQDHQRSRYSTKSSSYHYGGKSYHYHHQQQQQHGNGGRYTNSSQSTPIRRYQSNHNHYINNNNNNSNNNNNNNNRNETLSTKSTRSSSTTSESNKITFNEDEYTRITTPRQDVLFKKGYLNKPKTYQTQTSTGTSVTSAGNSTGNGTPDHQSTDLEYESQFVFPNGFVDQNGIYYINSYEPYPLMVYNPAPYYPDFANVRTKRSSTGSLTESTSPNNEEVSQDLSQENNGTNGGYYNVIYPGFFYNNTTITENSNTTTTTTTNNEIEEDGEMMVAKEKQGHCEKVDNTRKSPKKKKRRKPNDVEESPPSSSTSSSSSSSSNEDEECIGNNVKELQMNGLKSEDNNRNNDEMEDENEDRDDDDDGDEDEKKYDLKPDAEEFIPRAYRQPLPPTPVFLPLPIDFNGHTYLPHGIPINFIPPPQIPIQQQQYDNDSEDIEEEEEEEQEEEEEEEEEEVEENPRINEVNRPENHEDNSGNNSNNNNNIDIAVIVSKLEEAAKEQSEEQKIAKIDEDKSENCEESKKIEEQSMKINENLMKKSQNHRCFNSNPNQNQRKKNWKISQINDHNDNNNNNGNNCSDNSACNNLRNYSETLKKVPKNLPQITKKIEMKKGEIVVKSKDNKVGIVKNIASQQPQKQQQQQQQEKNQWISVSNRKKRKNRNNIDDLHNEDIEIETLVVDEEIKVEEQPIEDNKIDKIENTIVKKTNEVVQIGIEQEKQVENEEKVVIVGKIEETTNSEETFKTINRRKNKRSNKTNLKRVIVTDVDLSRNFEETQAQIEEIQTIVKKPLPVEEKVGKIEEIVETKDKLPLPPSITTTTTTVKKKKKKKSKVQSVTNSQTSSTLTLNTIDDNSYDFLLETFDNKTNDKTNIEISQELDKIIQKGIYNNLEEKIKSLKVINDHDSDDHHHEDNNNGGNDDENDDFFKTVLHNINKTTITPTTTIKSPDFTKLLKPSIFNNQTNHKQIITGDFLGVTTPTLHLGGGKQQQQQQQHKYPVTEAVKDWISKTRETTPELEILKSPQMIFEEFAEQFLENNDNDDDDSNDDNVGENDQKNVITSPLAPLCKKQETRERGVDNIGDHNDDDDDDEMTIFDQKDVKMIKTIDDITDNDDDIGIYDSKYGKNEDYLRIKTEINQHTHNNDRYNGNLPYRAICCSIT